MPEVKIRMGGYQAETSILTRALRRLAASLAAVPGAEWQVEVIRDVTERGARAADLLAMVERGEVELCYFAASYLAGRVPALGQFDEPFPSADRARLYADLDGERGARLAGDLEGLTGYKDRLDELEARTGWKNPGGPEHIVALVVWLGSPLATVNGRVFDVRAGHIDVAEGWNPGPTAYTKEGTFTVAELDAALPALIAKAAPQRNAMGDVKAYGPS